MENSSVDYQHVLDDLKARRDSMNDAIKAVENILGKSPGTGVAEIANVYRKMTIKDASIHFLRSSGSLQPTAAIAHALKNGRISSKSKNLYRSVYTILSTEAKRDSGQVVKSGNGWDLKERQR